MMLDASHGAERVRRRKQFWRKQRRLFAKPSAMLLALLAAFSLGRWSVRHPVKHVPDTPAIRDAAELEHSLAKLEAQLTQGEQWVTHNEELKRRHERVSALACEAAVSQNKDALRLAREKAMRKDRHAQPADEQDEDSEEQHASASDPSSLAGHPFAVRRTSVQ